MSISTYTLPTILRKTRVGNVEVSTITGLPGFADTRQTFAETLLFLEEGDMPEGFREQEGKRCPEADAIEQHEAYVAELRAGR